MIGMSINVAILTKMMHPITGEHGANHKKGTKYEHLKPTTLLGMNTNS